MDESKGVCICLLIVGIVLALKVKYTPQSEENTELIFSLYPI